MSCSPTTSRPHHPLTFSEKPFSILGSPVQEELLRTESHLPKVEVRVILSDEGAVQFSKELMGDRVILPSFESNVMWISSCSPG